MKATQTTAVAVIAAPEIATVPAAADEPTTEAAATTHAVAKAVSPEDARVTRLNRELDLLVSASYGQDRKNRAPWTDHAANFARLVEEVGGFMKVWISTINSFMYLCYDREVKAKIFDAVTRAYGEMFANKELLIAEEKRVIAYVTLGFMANKDPSVTAIYAAHGLEVPAKVEAKIAEGKKREADYAARKMAEQANIAIARKAQAFRHPRLHREMTLFEKGQVMLACGYDRVPGASKPGVLYFEGRDPETGVVVRKPIFGETPGVPGTKPNLPRGKSVVTRHHKPLSAMEKAHRESARDARRIERSVNPNQVASGKKK